MSFLRSAWKILVGIKDLLVLAFMLLFFFLLWSVLTVRPNPAAVNVGALMVKLDGALVEQPQEIDTYAALSGQTGAVKEQRLRDVVHAIESAAADSRITSVVLDLDNFTGGGQAAIERAGAAVDKVRAAGKPVLAFATGYTDDGYQLASHASEIWLDPLGLAVFTGPGGSRLYYKGLMDRLGVTAKVYRVGTYKSFVEPYTRTDQSPEAKQADQALVDALWQNWRDQVGKARPKAQFAAFIADPAARIKAAGGDLAKAALDAGLVDKLGSRTAFAARVAALSGPARDNRPDGFAQTRLADYVAANPPTAAGEAIGVITIAGSIVDGQARAGTAGGDTITRLIYDGLARGNLKALVVRVDSPGGSVMASEAIRQAILDAKRRGLPVVVSMGNVAASGGYWVSTPGDVIFAEPSTITGSIGVFGIIPTFRDALGKIGVTSDGVRTTPLSGQPDIVGGTNASFDAIAQSSVDNIYQRFVGLVSESRRLPREKVDQIAQGRVWDGGTARQIGLVDRFGTIEDAIVEAARRAKLDPAAVHPFYLDPRPNATSQWLRYWLEDDDAESGDGGNAMIADPLARIALNGRLQLLQAADDAVRMLEGPVVRAECLQCPRGLSFIRKRSGWFSEFTKWMVQ